MSRGSLPRQTAAASGPGGNFGSVGRERVAQARTASPVSRAVAGRPDLSMANQRMGQWAETALC
eukprot:9493674-Pyramimonas_sp.AAC.1